MTKKQYCTKYCPFDERKTDMDCLPSKENIIEMYFKGNGKWACHSNCDKPCQGLEDYLNNLKPDLIQIDGLNKNPLFDIKG